MNIILRFPKSWRTDVTVVRSGGRDSFGKPKPVQEFLRRDVLIAPRATSDPIDRSDVTESSVVLYDGDTSFIYYSTDRVRVPAGARMAGEWAVDGRPAEWPQGTELGLVRV